MLRGDLTRDGLTRGGLLTTVCVMALASWGVAQGDALDGVLEVRSAYVNLDKGVFLLHARIEYPMGPAIRKALRDGLTLTFDLDARVDRERRFWFNVNIVDVTLRRELSYHAVSDRYVVRKDRVRRLPRRGSFFSSDVPIRSTSLRASSIGSILTCKARAARAPMSHNPIASAPFAARADRRVERREV